MNNSSSIRASCEMIILKDSKILMGKRGNVFGKGSWAFPGGHLEFGEKTKDCVTRELGEEVGIRPVGMRILGIVNDIPNIDGQENHYIRFVYLIEKFTGKVMNKEPDKCEGWEWFDEKH